MCFSACSDDDIMMCREVTDSAAVAAGRDMLAFGPFRNKYYHSCDADLVRE